MLKPNQRTLLLLHIGFWLVFMLLKFFDFIENLPVERALSLILVQNSFNILASYLHYFLLLPIAVKRRNYLLYMVALLGFLFLIISFRGWVESMVFNSIFQTDYYQKWTIGRVLSLFLSTSSFMLFITFLNFTFDRFILEREKKELENEKLNAELNYLRAQINPHFLFNTLHNLNYLTHAKKDEASEVVVKLSNIMRYMIYDSNKSDVSVEKEVAYIRDYLNLEEIRLNNQFDIRFDVEIESANATIAPLILIPLVENSFKHGISDEYPESWVHMQLKIQDERLVFEVTNSLFNKPKADDSKSGFGLKNLNDRLKLTYKDGFDLKLTESGDRFKAHLEVRLS